MISSSRARLQLACELESLFQHPLWMERELEVVDFSGLTASLKNHVVEVTTRSFPLPLPLWMDFQGTP